LDTAARFCWTELGTTDTEKAAKFYARLFGWERTPPQLYSRGGNPLDYTLLCLGGQSVGGLHPLSGAQRRQGVRPRWLPYVGVGDAASASARARELGATVLVGPLDVLDLGRLTILRDPEGALLGTWQSTGLERDFQEQDQPGCASWFEHVSDDIPRAARFYGALFGWSQRSPAEEDGGRILLDHGGVPVAGLRSSVSASGKLSPQWLTYFRTEDCEASCQKVVAQHGSIVAGPIDAARSERLAVANDPQGAAFGLQAPFDRRA
jgi:predicted enzyme related to lactoylglutathione lyase